MYGEYGYIEEGKLGKPYNFRFLKRLAPYALPYKRILAKVLFLTVLITLGGLTLPYLSKIAIDRYILSSWYLLDLRGTKRVLAQDIMRRYGHFLIESRDRSLYVVSHMEIKKIDPADLRAYETEGILRKERFFRVSPSSDQSGINGVENALLLADGSRLIPHDTLDSLPKSDLLKIRAEDIRGVSLVGALFVILLFVSFWLEVGEHYLMEYAGQRIMQDIRLALFHKMQSQALSFFNRHPVGRLVTRVTNDTENLNEMFKSVIITVFKDIFLLAGIVIVLFSLNWQLALVCFSLIPLIFALALLFSYLAREAFRELRATVAKINAFLQERLSGMRVIQLFAAEESQMESFRRINHANYLAGMKQIRVFAVFMPVMELFSSFAVALLIWHGGAKVLDEQLSLGALVAFVGYMQMFFKPIRDISEKYNIMQSAMASIERIFEFMDLNEGIPRSPHPVAVPTVKGHLIFDKVSFGYEDGLPVLQDISFEVHPGEKVAIVGPTGSGKTTLVNLIERFYDPQKGAVLLDRVDLREWSPNWLRRNIGLVMQDVFIFAGNVEDNITLGQVEIGRKDLELAAEQSNATMFIRRLPKGFHQEISESGSSLSAGERQLLSFARALAYAPALLILDEATSSVDPETERLIQEAISRITAERTTLVVAHRLSTIRNADRILVLHRGRLIEQGTHEQLMALGGVYHKLNRIREE